MEKQDRCLHPLLDTEVGAHKQPHSGAQKFFTLSLMMKQRSRQLGPHLGFKRWQANTLALIVVALYW